MEVDTRSAESHTETYALAALWPQFDAQFPTERDCLEELYRKFASQGLMKCRYCATSFNEIRNRVVRCRICKKDTWLTAGTFFHHLRSARPWLAAIWLLEHGVTISSCRFHKLVGVAYSTAWNIYKKLATVMQQEMTEDAVSAPSALFMSIVCKRSRETPARSHPRAEQREEVEEPEVIRGECDPEASNWIDSIGSDSLAGSILQSRNCEFPGDKAAEQAEAVLVMSDEQNSVYALLSDQRVHFDVLCERTGLSAGKLSALLMLLELDGNIMRCPGDFYLREGKQAKFTAPRGSPVSTVQSTVIALADKVVDFLRLHFRGISRKYLQQHLAIYWCSSARSRWGRDALLQVCMRSGVIRLDDILDYVTPAVLRIAVD